MRKGKQKETVAKTNISLKHTHTLTHIGTHTRSGDIYRYFGGAVALLLLRNFPVTRAIDVL